MNEHEAILCSIVFFITEPGTPIYPGDISRFVKENIFKGVYPCYYAYIRDHLNYDDAMLHEQLTQGYFARGLAVYMEEQGLAGVR